MNRRVFPLIAVGSAVLTASCSTAPAQETRSPRAARELASALAGRTAGPPVRCLPGFRTTQMQIVDDFTILYRDGRTTYVQNPRGGCRGIANGGYTMVIRQFGTNQQCDGDIAQLVDLSSNFTGGSCIFGPFTPYTKPR